ncbi:hypothetical protein [Klebsiella aerogenes]|uniref:hypothetical protein n=1 Tax=Klebsiella aerogenes TaxID=548 RepID=UPI001D0D840C|nr:hypothetical protein [Klebsiella aerogenes]
MAHNQPPGSPVTLRYLLIATLAITGLSVSGIALADTIIKKAIPAMKCKPDKKENNGQGSCPLPADLWQSDPAYKKDMESALQNYGVTGVLGPEGSLNGPQDAIAPVVAEGKTWLQGSFCEQSNCGDHYLRFLYQPEEHQVLGFYFDGKEHWIGEPLEDEAKLLRGNTGVSTVAQPPVSAPAASPDGAPANTIWAFTGDGGKSLWQVCGKQNSSCTIIANTKYYVAILNRKSAHSCAFGDFYVADRDAASWHQYDTGTCSPDAWIRKGSISNGQYLSVDIGVNNQMVQQYPIGYWSMKKEFSGNRRPSWSKVKAKNLQH